MFTGYKLGKLEANKEHGAPLLARYMTEVVPDVPNVDYLDHIKIPYGMLMNDQIGCCTLSAVGHIIMSFSALDADAVMQYMTDAEIEAYYKIIGHWNPEDPATDQGCILADVLNYWMVNGIRCGTEINKIYGYSFVDPTNVKLLRYALYNFGSIDLGLKLPQYCEKNTTWEIVPDMGPILGGHCTTINAMDDNWFYGVSWGEKIQYSAAFISQYADEAFVVHNDHFTNPIGLDYTTLEADLTKIKTRQIA